MSSIRISYSNYSLYRIVLKPKGLSPSIINNYCKSSNETTKDLKNYLKAILIAFYQNVLRESCLAGNS